MAWMSTNIKRRKWCCSAPSWKTSRRSWHSMGLWSRVIRFKLLGFYVCSNLKRAQHGNAISSKVQSWLYFLKQLKRCGVSVVDLLCFYTPQWCVQCSSKLRPMLVRSGTRVWRRPAQCTGVVTEEGHANNFQPRWLSHFAIISSSLQARRKQLAKHFFLRNVFKEIKSLHYQLPVRRDLNTVNRLRHTKTSELSQTGTERFRRLSIPYSVSSSATFRSRLKTELFSAAYY